MLVGIKYWNNCASVFLTIVYHNVLSKIENNTCFKNQNLVNIKKLIRNNIDNKIKFNADSITSEIKQNVLKTFCS